MLLFSYFYLNSTMTTPPKISIIIPIYKAEQYLRDCLNSCLNQTFNNFEIIAVNDGSPDNCSDILDKYANLDGRIKIIEKINEGLVEARKTGVSNAVGEYIFFLDSDDTLPSSALEELVETTEDCDLVIGNLDIVTSRGELLRTIKNKLTYGSSVTGILNAIVSKKIVGSLCGRLIRRTLWQRSNTDKHFSIGEDFITNLQICSLPLTVKCVDKSVYNYIQYKDSMSHIFGEKTANGRLKFINWVVDFMQSYTNDVQTNDALALFAIEEYFSYLRDGGKLDNCAKLTLKINNVYLHNQFARSNVALWRLIMVKLYKLSPLLGKFYRFIFVELRKLVRK